MANATRTARADYAEQKRRARERIMRLTLAGRDIGAIPNILNVRRRSKCRESLKLFCETYNPEAFSLGWSSDHLRVIARIEEAVTHGALYALAMPRGAGKTTICRMATLWAVSYGLCRYPFVIGANAGKAQDTLSAIKSYVRFLSGYGDDFPELAFPAACLGGIAQRANGQLCQGQPTLIEWSQDRIILPTVRPPKNWPKRWPLRSDGMVPTSGSIISASGLTGDGIRGSLVTTSTGESVRPDFVLLDDPQTSESSASASQNVTREHLVSADVLGMAGPGKRISAVMPCTVISQGDFVDRILDRKRHPIWRGERTKMLRTMPTDLGAWTPYFELYAQCAGKEPPDFAESTAYYREHQASLEAGAEASWEARKEPDEVSAIQNAMHLYFRDKVAFFSEYQNDPLPLIAPLPGELTADAIASRINRHARQLAPSRTTRLTAFVDISQDLLWWAVCAWEEGFTGAVIDHGAWPDQGRAYYTLAEARPTIRVVTGIGSLEGSLHAALTALCAGLLGRDWPIDGGAALRIERCLIDSGWGASTELVKRFCRQSAHAASLSPSKGYGIGASGNPMSDWARKPGERRGMNWMMPAAKPGEGRMVLFDTNSWKSFVHGRLATPLGERGALTLFGDDARVHRMLADHLTAEYRVRTQGRGRELDEWKLRPSRPDNHLFDAIVGAAVGAAVAGVSLEEMKMPTAKREVSFAAMQAEARQRQGRQ